MLVIVSSFRSALSDDGLNSAASAVARQFIAEHFPESTHHLADAIKQEKRRLRMVPRPRSAIAHPSVNTKDLEDVLAYLGIKLESGFLAKMKAAQGQYGQYGRLFDNEY